MENPYWSGWANRLKSKELVELSSLILEGIAPVRYVFSTLLNASAPFFGPVTRSSLNALADLVEDPHESRDFLRYVRERGAE